MVYTEVIKALDDEAERKKLVTVLKNSPRNAVISLLQDYYEGKQWQLDGLGNMGETRFTRSKKEMWKPLDSKNINRGYTAGQLKVWNISGAAIDVYAEYARGDSNDQSKIIIEQNNKANDDLSKMAMSIFPDLDEFIIRAVTRASITSIAATKYTAYENKSNKGTDTNDAAILKTITLADEDVKAEVDLIDSKEIEPLYWYGKIRGYIRFYPMDKAEARERLNEERRPKDPLYIEVWYVDDSNKVIVKKYIDQYELVDESGVAPYDFLPYYLKPNKKSETCDYDINHIEVSDIDNLTELQDDLNAFLTDVGVINRNVAMPMLKVTDDFFNASKDAGKDLDKLKEVMAKMSTQAGNLLFGPFERLGGDGISDSTIRYLQDIFEEYYRETGIPRSVFNSEGLASMSGVALDNLFQSLKTKVGAKRTMVANIIEQNVKMHLTAQKKWQPDMTIRVVMPSIFSVGVDQVLRLLESGARNGLPSKYVTEYYAELLGDSEDAEAIVAEAIEENAVIKSEVESVLARNRVRENTAALARTIADAPSTPSQ